MALLCDLSKVDLHNPDPTLKISPHFTLREALWLPTWGRMGNATDGLTPEILTRVCNFVAKECEKVREHVAAPMIIHVCWRPESYNKLVGGARKSAHVALSGSTAAIDFHVKGFEGGAGCDQIRAKLKPKLAEFGIRMEDLPNSSWVHVDCAPVPKNGNRFFKP